MNAREVNRYEVDERERKSGMRVMKIDKMERKKKLINRFKF